MAFSVSTLSVLITSAFSAVLLSSAANAQSLTGSVGSAAINEGERAVESRIGFDGDGNTASRFQFEYAFTDWYQLRVIGAFSRPDDGDWSYSRTTLENWFQWREEAEDGAGSNGGIRVAYTFSDDGGPDQVTLRLTLTDEFADGWEWRANLIGEIETGDDSADGVFLETRAQLSRSLDLSAFGSSELRLGVELFSEYGNSEDISAFDEQAHQLGPVLKAEWDNGVFIQTGARFGLTGASGDSIFRLSLGREF
jgi:hypothetical protein